jgi:hypothetical protein
MQGKDNDNKPLTENVNNSRRKVLGKLAYMAPTLIALGHIKEVNAQFPSVPCPPNKPGC